jgi:hypothetical protein
LGQVFWVKSLGASNIAVRSGRAENVAARAANGTSFSAKAGGSGRGGGAWPRRQPFKTAFRAHARRLAAPSRPNSAHDPPSELQRGRGEGRVFATPMSLKKLARLQKKSRRQSPQVWPQHPAFPARWLYGLYVLSPGTGLIAPVFATTLTRCADTSTGMPGPHDFAVRIRLSVGMR